MDEIAGALDALRRGGLVAFPTETVYGLGADATDSAAVARLFAVKGRPGDHPVIAHVARAEDLDRWADPVPEPARRLAEALWPGACTVIVPRRIPGIVDEVTGGRRSVALRMPDHPVALALLRAFDRPVAAPSANRFGRVSPTRASDVRADLGDDVDVILDGGPCAVGIESTIVDCSVSPPVLRRSGGVPQEHIEEILGHQVARSDADGGAPGTLATHYAPRARVEVVDAGALAVRSGSLIAMGLRIGVVGSGVEVPDGALDLTADDVEHLAHVLYARLRHADATGLDVVLAVTPAPAGLGAAVADRLRRAAGSPA